MTSYRVGYLVGSLAKASINRLLATALVRLAPAQLQMSEIPFRDLPLYSYDYDANYPPVATAFKDAIAAVDAVLFVTPEYNRSIPGGSKNAIDWASRPYGKNAFARKPSGINRHIARQDRHRHRPAAPSQHSRLLQFAADEFR
jgi:chromate reductase, NAD(P)H dehydrogenase (quinone)